MIVNVIRGSIFHPNQSLEEYVFRFVPKLKEKSVLVVTSKIVALAQGRVEKSGRGKKVRLIKRESDAWVKTKWCYLTLNEGHWCPNAGIDESNADGSLILWPEDSFGAAEALRKALKKHYGLKQVGVVITDSRTLPLRSGVTGVTLGYAGIKGLRDYRGKTDIFGRTLKMTQTNVADGLAAAAVFVMGEGNERTPLCVVEGAPVVFTERVQERELRIDPRDDMYKPVFARAMR